MDKIVELTKSQKDEDKLLIAKILDKLKMVQAKNRVENTDFLDLAQKSLAEDILKKGKEENYIFFGGYEQAERTMLVLYPFDLSDFFKMNIETEVLKMSNNRENPLEISNNTKESLEMSENIKEPLGINDNDKKSLKMRNNIKAYKIFNNIMSVVRISLPKELWNEYEHKSYLGAMIKLGIKREKIGDIIVREDGADIIISSEIEKFLVNNLGTLIRFQKAKIESIKLEEIKYVKKEKQIIKINVPSMRLDAIVGELAKVSRNDANKYIEQERVFVNFKLELRNSLQIEENTIITIRGKGRFRLSKILGETKSKRINLQIEKW